MKKLYILLSVTLISYTSYCQNVYGIEADSIKLSNGSSNSELIIENSTRNVPGFLYNIGNGRTEFREVLNGGLNGDSAAYHSIQQGTDSTYFTISNLNGTIDTVQLIYDSSTIDVGSGVTQAQLDDSTAAIRADFPGVNNSWGLTGNSGTTDSNFIGTTDNVPLIFKSFGGVKSGFTGGGYSVAFGYNTYSYDTASLYAYSDNVAFGVNALSSLNRSSTLTNAGNVAVGCNALAKTKWGWANIAIGSYSLNGTTSSNITFKGNIALGFQSLTSLQSGNENTSLGDSSLRLVTTGNYNIGLGTNAAKGVTSSNNTFYISDSTYHMKYKLDSAAGTAPSVIGRDADGYWHVYQNAKAIDSTVTLSSGTITVSDSRVKTGAKIFLSVNTPSGTQGFLSAKTSDIVNGASFIINSTSATDESTVNYMILNP